MAMSKKDFIALGNRIKQENAYAERCGQPLPFTEATITILAAFCRSQNYNFMESRWRDFIAGECGPNGGEVKAV